MSPITTTWPNYSRLFSSNYISYRIRFPSKPFQRRKKFRHPLSSTIGGDSSDRSILRTVSFELLLLLLRWLLLWYMLMSLEPDMIDEQALDRLRLSISFELDQEQYENTVDWLLHTVNFSIWLPLSVCAGINGVIIINDIAVPQILHTSQGILSIPGIAG